MCSVFVQLCAGEDKIRTILGILFKNLNEGVTSRTGKGVAMSSY